MADALVGFFDATEGAFDHIQVHAVVLLVLQAVVHTGQADETDQVVIRLALVGDRHGDGQRPQGVSAAGRRRFCTGR